MIENTKLPSSLLIMRQDTAFAIMKPLHDAGRRLHWWRQGAAAAAAAAAAGLISVFCINLLAT
jgi:hypothetical protein